MKHILSDKMSSRKSAYHFYPEIVKLLIRQQGGYAEIAAQLRTTTRTLERTIRNQSRNGRLQRDILTVLRRAPETVGYYMVPETQVSTNGQQAA